MATIVIYTLNYISISMKHCFSADWLIRSFFLRHQGTCSTMVINIAKAIIDFPNQKRRSFPKLFLGFAITCRQICLYLINFLYFFPSIKKIISFKNNFNSIGSSLPIYNDLIFLGLKKFKYIFSKKFHLATFTRLKILYDKKNVCT